MAPAPCTSLQFPDIVQFCEEMANLGKTVIVAALDGTFQRKVGLVEPPCGRGWVSHLVAGAG